VADQPIIKIPLDSAEFDEFTDKFMRYQKKLEEQPEAWAGTRKGIKNSNSEFKEMGKALNALVNKSTDPKFAKSFGTIQKGSKETETSWAKIVKDIEKSTKEMTNFSRLSLGGGGMGMFGKLLGLGGIASLLTSIYGGVVNSAATVAAQNKSSKSLGLDLGKEQAFGIYGKQLGLTRDDLENAENAKEDATQRLPFITAGITDDQFQNMDAAELAWQTAKNKAKMYSEWEQTSPQFALNQAQARGWQDSPDELRLLARNYRDGKLDPAQQDYENNWKKMGLDQAAADQDTAFDTHQAANWQDIETAWHLTAGLTLPPGGLLRPWVLPPIRSTISMTLGRTRRPRALILTLLMAQLLGIPRMACL
jgi:hypothetical protein